MPFIEFVLILICATVWHRATVKASVQRERIILELERIKGRIEADNALTRAGLLALREEIRCLKR